MAIFYNEGEVKIRPGVYQRHTSVGMSLVAGALDGYCAIPVQASWGPVGKVLKNTSKKDLERNYGTGTYGTGYTVPAAAAMFDGGAAVVYTYRLGTGGTKASKEITSGLIVTAKHPGTMPISIAVQQKLGDATKKLFLVYTGTTLVEKFEFAADTKAESANLIAAAAESDYVDIAGEAATVPALAVASGALEGGVNPTVTNEDYSTAFAALEPYYYNTIALDVDDDEGMTLSLLLQEYLDNAYIHGKQGIAVIGEKSDVEFEARLAHASAINDVKNVYLGNGYMAGTTSKGGVLAICYTAGVIASTPSNKGITHTIVKGATDLCEPITNSQLEDAISAGMLMFSVSPDGSVWYDSAINTLTNPDEATQDAGWKKIRRVKTRFELIDRLDRTLAPKVGKVSADTDGIADIVQSGQNVIDAMIGEGKLATGGKFMEDPDNPYYGDSAWFIIQVDDIDSLEKIYLQYQFRYSQNA